MTEDEVVCIVRDIFVNHTNCTQSINHTNCTQISYHAMTLLTEEDQSLFNGKLYSLFDIGLAMRPARLAPEAMYQ